MKQTGAGKQFWFLLTGFLFCFVVLIEFKVEAAKPKVPKTKIGASHLTHSTGNYTLTDQSTGESGKASGNLVGFAFFAEQLFMDKFSAGFKYGYGLERSIDMQLGTSSLDILESASFWELEFRAFAKDNLSPGLKPFLGVGYGNYTVTSTITVIPVSGSTSEETTSATIPFVVLSVGADYTFGFGGIRLEVGQATGKRNDLEGSSTYYASYNYDGTVVGISVYSFF